MSIVNSKTPRIAELAERLITDIGERNLGAGDRYFTTVEASRMLGVGNSAANRALQMLQRRGIITRQQRRGAIITKSPNDELALPLRRVHFLVHQKYLRTEGVGNDDVLIGMQQRLPGVQVQISFLPVGDEAQFIERLLEESLKGNTVDGFVLVRSSFETQRLIASSRLPAVVYGTAYRGVGDIAQVNRDMYGIGQELTQYLLSRGHRTFACINRQHALPGDQLTLDAMIDCIGKYGLLANALTIRFFPADELICLAGMRELLGRKDRPTAWICRTAFLANAVEMAMKELAIPRKGTDIVVCDYYLRQNEPAVYTYAQPILAAEEQGALLARVLADLAQGTAPGELNEIIPVHVSMGSGARRGERK